MTDTILFIWILFIPLGTNHVGLSSNWNVTNVTETDFSLFPSYLKLKSQPIKSRQVLNSFPQSQCLHCQCLIIHHVTSGYIIGQYKSRAFSWGFLAPFGCHLDGHHILTRHPPQRLSQFTDVCLCAVGQKSFYQNITALFIITTYFLPKYRNLPRQ